MSEPRQERVLQPETPAELLTLQAGDIVSKSALSDLIQLSKVAGSRSWQGPEHRVGNTPQQGINWIGSIPEVKAVVVKSKDGAYGNEGWTDSKQQLFKYALKSQQGLVNRGESANRVLIEQPLYRYPVILLVESASAWSVLGQFNVVIATDAHVILRPTSIDYPWDLAGTTLIR